MRKLKRLFEGRPCGRLSYFVLALVVALLSARLEAQAPQLTQITDTLYRPDGTPAQGTILIRWQNFTTSDNKAVPAGMLNLAIGPGGAVSLALAPNTGATPAGSYYAVTYQLSDGTHAEEYWAVPAVSPTTIGAIRSTIVPKGVAMQVVSRQYVDEQLALKAADANVAHNTGDETLAGVKTFVEAPLVPTPSAPEHAASKSYVDANAGGASPAGLRYTERFTGPNLGAQITAAVANCGANCRIVINGTSGTVSEALSLPANTTLEFGPGTFTWGAAQTLGNAGIHIVGAGPGSTVFEASLPTGDLFTITAANVVMSGFTVRPASGVVRTASALFHVTSTLGHYHDLAILDPYNGFFLDGDNADQNTIERVKGASSGGNWNYFARTYASAGTIASTYFGNIALDVRGAGTQTDALFVFDSRTDTVKMNSIEALTRSKPAVKTVDSDGVGAYSYPRFMLVNNSLFEHGYQDSAGSDCALELLDGRLFLFRNGHVGGSGTGDTRSCGVHVGGNFKGADVSGVEFISLQKEGVKIDTGAQDAQFSYNKFQGVSLAADATYDVFHVGANTSDVDISHNVARRGSGSFYGRYGVAVDAGTSTRLIVTNNNFVNGVSTAQFSNGATGGQWAFRNNAATSDDVKGFDWVLRSNGADVIWSIANLESARALRWTLGNRDVKFDSAGGSGCVRFTASSGTAPMAAICPNTGSFSLSGPLTSSVATGTAPLSIASTTAVANLTLAADSQLPTITSAAKVADSALSANVSLLGQTVGGAELDDPAVGSKGGVQARTCPGTDKLSAIGADGVPVCSADQTSAGGSAVSVNGSSASDADLDDSTPSAPASSINVRWQKDGSTPSNVSANVPYGAGLATAGGGLAVSLSTCEAYRSSDFTLTANTYADNVSCSLSAGTWLLIADTTVKSPNATAQRVTVKLWDGTTVYASSEEGAPSQGAGATGYVSLSLSKIVTLGSTTTVKTSVASTVASVLDATPDDNATGIGNTANSIRAVRIGN
ncbi:MAG TPA: hypothetical protein VLA96_02115 [Terriglobales bacterium]|nr:hypothetical protein [Terriglobales bacterium]